MDGNKDEALKCVRIGKKALESGERSRALKFFSKASRLDPSLRIDDLLAAADDGESQDSSATQGQSNPSDPPCDEPKSSSSPKSTTAGARVSTEASSRSYTEGQLAIVRQIKRQKDYYQILGLERGCTVEDVRKGYRKLSLKIHPDKNKAPGSDEAFKAVSKAFQCLSNDESRKRYDLVGSEEPNYGGPAAARGHTHDFNGFYDAYIDPNEIFRNFFFGGMAPATTPFGTFRFRTDGMEGQGSNFNLRSLIQMLPIIFSFLRIFSRPFSHLRNLCTCFHDLMGMSIRLRLREGCHIMLTRRNLNKSILTKVQSAMLWSSVLRGNMWGSLDRIVTSSCSGGSGV